MTTVLDYANWRPPGGAVQLKAAGVVGVVRYIAPASWGWPKALTPLELFDLQTHGVLVACNFERTAGDYLGGANQGVANGQAAQQAMAELGLGDPKNVVYVSVDTLVPAANIGLAQQYVGAFYTACHHAPRAVYGEGLVIAGANATYGWLSESTSFPGSPAAKIVLRQQYGQTVPNLPGAYDVNQAAAADWGQLKTTTPIPPPKVAAMYNPPIDVLPDTVASCNCPAGGAWSVTADGHVYAWGTAPYRGAPYGQGYWAGRTAARIDPAGSGYKITASSGETYNF